MRKTTIALIALFVLTLITSFWEFQGVSADFTNPPKDGYIHTGPMWTAQDWTDFFTSLENKSWYEVQVQLAARSRSGELFWIPAELVDSVLRENPAALMYMPKRHWTVERLEGSLRRTHPHWGTFVLGSLNASWHVIDEANYQLVRRELEDAYDGGNGWSTVHSVAPCHRATFEVLGYVPQHCQATTDPQD